MHPRKVFIFMFPCFDSEDFPWAIFGAGILRGLAIGPLLDLAWVIRERWREVHLEPSSPITKPPMHCSRHAESRLLDQVRDSFRRTSGV